MHVHNTSNSNRKSLRHPRKIAIRFARGQTVHNLPRLQRHLGVCLECRDVVLFIQKLTNALRGQRLIGRERPSIDSELRRIGLNREEAAEIFKSWRTSHM